MRSEAALRRRFHLNERPVSAHLPCRVGTPHGRLAAPAQMAGMRRSRRSLRTIRTAWASRLIRPGPWAIVADGRFPSPAPIHQMYILDLRDTRGWQFPALYLASRLNSRAVIVGSRAQAAAMTCDSLRVSWMGNRVLSAVLTLMAIARLASAVFAVAFYKG